MLWISKNLIWENIHKNQGCDWLSNTYLYLKKLVIIFVLKNFNFLYDLVEMVEIHTER